MIRIKQCLLLMTCILNAACTSQYLTRMSESTLGKTGLTDTFWLTRAGKWVLHPSTKICLAAAPGEGQSRGDTYPRALSTLYRALERELLFVFPHSVVKEERLTRPALLAAAARQGASVIIYADIMDYVNKLNTGREINEGRGVHPDRRFGRDTVYMRLVVEEVHTGNTLDILQVESKPGIFKDIESNPDVFYKQVAGFMLASLSSDYHGRMQHFVHNETLPQH